MNPHMNSKSFATGLLTAVIAVVLPACSPEKPADNDGHALWLGPAATAETSASITTLDLVQNNLALLGLPVKVKELSIPDDALGEEGYRLEWDGSTGTLQANTPVGLLYGSFEWLRREACDRPLQSGESFESVPVYRHRVLNHWDNPDGSVERGFAGQSLWKWDDIVTDDVAANAGFYAEYARANASVGLNGTVLNNVNADPCMLSAEYLLKVKALADIFRPYGLKVYLSVNFASPKHLGGLKTSDPLEAKVAAWWRDKVAEIYALIPDFGGFLVKANSEGQSGPQDYGRTHADGANMLADALKPYGGIVMWRAFVYAATSPDRARQAVEEFQPLDGQFRDNVIIQIKNGPVDFQPREPFSPLFGQLEKTQVMAEMQITQEYLGHSNHLVFLHPMWKECLDSDTYQKGAGTTVAAVTQGKIFPYRQTAIAGVANIGDSINWCGHPFAQANWYAFGRMAWNSALSSEQIADEWLRQTFAVSDARFLHPVREMMLTSRETTVRYEMPLGLHHLFAGAGHYGPGPWEGSVRPDWSPMYYHKAGPDGVGFDRTLKGTAAVEQYHEPLCSLYNDVTTCPEELLLWFHHLPWGHRMKSGRTLWEELCLTYQSGFEAVCAYRKIWQAAEPYVDRLRFRQVAVRLERQAKDALWWRDAVVGYFQSFSGLDLPEGCTPIQHDLEWLQRFRLHISNYETPGFDKLPPYEL